MHLRYILGLLNMMKKLLTVDSVGSSAQDGNVKRDTHLAPTL